METLQTTICSSETTFPQQKIPGSVKQWKVPGKKCITTVSKENFEKKVTTTMVDFQQQSTQRLVN